MHASVTNKFVSKCSTILPKCAQKSATVFSKIFFWPPHPFLLHLYVLIFSKCQLLLIIFSRKLGYFFFISVLYMSRLQKCTYLLILFYYSVMLGAGLLAQKAVEKGLRVSPYIKTSLSPGSGVVTYYLQVNKSFSKLYFTPIFWLNFFYFLK